MSYRPGFRWVMDMHAVEHELFDFGQPLPPLSIHPATCGNAIAIAPADLFGPPYRCARCVEMRQYYNSRAALTIGQIADTLEATKDRDRRQYDQLKDDMHDRWRPVHSPIR